MSPPGCWLPLFCSRTNCPICRCCLLLEETYDVSDLPVVTLLLICNYCSGVKTVKSREWSNILVKTFTVPVQARPRPSGPHLGSHTSHVTMCPTKNTNCSFSPLKCNTVRSPERDLSRNCKNSSWMYFYYLFLYKCKFVTKREESEVDKRYMLSKIHVNIFWLLILTSIFFIYIFPAHKGAFPYD